jgi:hypothetical protein
MLLLIVGEFGYPEVSMRWLSRWLALQQIILYSLRRYEISVRRGDVIAQSVQAGT